MSLILRHTFSHADAGLTINSVTFLNWPHVFSVLIVPKRMVWFIIRGVQESLKYVGANTVTDGTCKLRRYEVLIKEHKGVGRM